MGLQQELVAWVQFPQDGQDALVGKQHLAERFGPAHLAVRGECLRGKFLLEQGLLRIKFEEGKNSVLVRAVVDEAVAALVPSEFGHE